MENGTVQTQGQGKGKAIAGLVLGILSLIVGWIPVYAVAGLPLAVVGLVLSVVGGKQCKAAGEPSGLATAGLVIGIIAVVCTAVTFFTCGICTICTAGLAAFS